MGHDLRLNCTLNKEMLHLTFAKQVIGSVCLKSQKVIRIVSIERTGRQRDDFECIIVLLIIE
jgi:hypothetical protein